MPKLGVCTVFWRPARGGFIGYVEEYSVMGMSERNYHACGEAFRRLTPPIC